MKHFKKISLLGLIIGLSACGLTGLGPSPSHDFEEADKNLSEAALNEILEPPVTRGTTTSYTYKPITCKVKEADSYSCENLDLITDAGTIDINGTTSFNNSTDNHTSYYMFMNKSGKCLISTTSNVHADTCDVTSDKQKFRLSFVSADYSFFKIKDTQYNTKRYAFSIIPKVNTKGSVQSYATGESSMMRKANSAVTIEHSTDCSVGSEKCTFYFYDTTSSYFTSSSANYTLTNSDGSSSNTGHYFYLQNRFFRNKNTEFFGLSPTTVCLRSKDDRFKIDDTSSYECTKGYNSEKMLWRIFKVIES